MYLLYPHLYSFLCWCMFRLFPCPGYCKWCCSEHWSAFVILNYGFLLVMELSDNMVAIFLVFKGISILFFIVAVPIYIPTNSATGLPFSTPSPAFIACRLLDHSHSDWHEMVPHCGFDLHFSDNEWCWASFHVFAICMSSLEYSNKRHCYPSRVRRKISKRI